MSYIIDITVKAADSDDPSSVKPAGQDWYVVKNKNGEPQDFNQGAGGKYIYIFYQTGTTGQAIIGFRFITGDGVTPPAGWTMIQQDLNQDAGGKYIYLCYAKDSNFPYIDSMQSGYGSSVGSAMEDFPETAVVMTQDTNQDAGGKYVFLGYFYNYN